VLVIGIGTLAAIGHAAPPVEAARVQPLPVRMLAPAEAIAPSLRASETTARWSDVPAIIAEVPPLEPQPESDQN
jgi:hypothetical protein